MHTSIRLGSLFGIPIGLNLSWFISFGLVLLILGFQIYPLLLPDESAALQWLLALASAFLFFGSILAHELAHGLVARGFGVPVKGVTLFVFGGIAQIAREASRPGAEFIIALVGPLTSIVLSLAFLGVWLATGADNGAPDVLWEWLWLMNLAIGVFNLAPGFPMDGGRLLRSALWGLTGNFSAATRLSSGLGQLVGYGLIVVGALSALNPAWWPLDTTALGGLWLLLIGLFLENAARSSYQRVRFLDALGRHHVVDVMVRSFATVEAREPLASVTRQALTGNQPCVFVVEGGQVLGVVTAASARRAARDGREGLTATDAMVPAAGIPVAQADEDLGEVFQRMEAAEATFLPVVDRGALVGVLGRDAILRRARSGP